MTVIVSLALVALTAMGIGIFDGIGLAQHRIALYVSGAILAFGLALDLVLHNRPLADAAYVASVFPLAIDDWTSASIATRSLVYATIISLIALLLPPYNIMAFYNITVAGILFIAIRLAELSGQRLPIADTLVVCLSVAILGIPGLLATFVLAIGLLILGLMDRRRSFMERVRLPVLVPVAGVIVTIALLVLALPLPWYMQ